MKFERASGILLHPTSLPGPYGIGDIGPQAFHWLDFLAQAGCRLWQILPLGPTGYGDSPYQCFSAMAGNPYLISPEALVADGMLKPGDLDDRPAFPAGEVDYDLVIPWKLELLDQAFQNFQKRAGTALQQEFIDFRDQQRAWLEDFALFMALKEAHDGAPWSRWDAALKRREERALEQSRRSFAEAIQRQMFRQFIFTRQWSSLHRYAAKLGIRIIGDIPIFVAHDSSEVWTHPELFQLDEDGHPLFVAGVPPDYFTKTGQLWGNPLYQWEIHAADGYSWWIGRFRSVLKMVDIVRLDHFRGFVGYWEVPGDAKTAEIGRWVPGPGAAFFERLQNELGDLPIIAEDLGVITPDVVELRKRFDLPGMKILQFAFSDGPQDPFLPHNYPTHCVVYTGTHDNDTVRGWYERVPNEEVDFYRRYLDRDGSNVAWDMIRACWASIAVYSIAPLQDFLDLGNEARMNFPGKPQGNWRWRVPEGAPDAQLALRIKELNYLYGRLPSTSQFPEVLPDQKHPQSQHRDHDDLPKEFE